MQYYILLLVRNFSALFLSSLQSIFVTENRNLCHIAGRLNTYPTKLILLFMNANVELQRLAQSR